MTDDHQRKTLPRVPAWLVVAVTQYQERRNLRSWSAAATLLIARGLGLDDDDQVIVGEWGGDRKSKSATDE